MPGPLERLAAGGAYLRAKRVYAGFLRSLRDVRREQAAALRRALTLIARSDFGRRHALGSVRSPEDLRRAVPLATYEDLRPYIERVWEGDSSALFSPGQRLVMFATSSGTTAKPKLIPVTPQFERDYRRGWNTFGLKMLSDHPAAILRAILQGSGRFDASLSPAGVPCGAITGLLARTQKRIVRRFYVGRPQIAHLPDARARYYTLMRLGISRDVAFAITANPATLIQMARTAAEESETLIRDVRDGTLSPRIVPEAGLRRVLAAGLRPNSARAARLELWRSAAGTLRPRDYWNLDFLACWTGGSMGHYLERLREWYGQIPIRDVGLLASEGRVSIPLEDDTPAGVLDVQAALFEFIPIDEIEAEQPQTLWAWELETGCEYAVVLTNRSGLVRYRLDDVVRVRGCVEQTPVVEFLYRAGRVASVAGEKLTENQVVEAVRDVCGQLGISHLDFVLAPCWSDPPYYRLSYDGLPDAVRPDKMVPSLAAALDRELCEQNDEYASRRKSRRLDNLQVRVLPAGTLTAMDVRLMRLRDATAEQYKRPALFTSTGDDDRALGLQLQLDQRGL